MSEFTKYAFETVKEINKEPTSNNEIKNEENSNLENKTTPDTQRTLHSDIDLEEFYS